MSGAPVTLNATEALPCPFCGSPPEIEPWHGGAPTKHRVSCSNIAGTLFGDPAKTCEVGPGVTGETREEALANWNRRAAAPTPTQPSDDERAAIEQLRHECAGSGYHDHDGCSCTDAELLIRVRGRASLAAGGADRRAVLEEAAFLLDRLDDFYRAADLDSDAYREWNGHVVPSMSRLRALAADKGAGA